MNIQTLLAVTDLSVRGHHVLERAALLALEHSARLDILYLPAPGNPPCEASGCRLAHQALQLGQRHGIHVHTTTARTQADLVARGRGVDLIVTSDRTDRRVQALWRGPPLAQLLRACQRPVLVVRRPASAPYQRLLVAVDLDDASRRLVALASALGTKSEVELFHALHTLPAGKLRSADLSEHAIKAIHQESARRAGERMFWLTDSSSARRNRVYAAIGRGDPARQIGVQQQHSGADLVVVGKPPASALGDLLLGSTALRALAASTVDVLVVPHGFQLASGPSALRRMTAVPPTRRRVRAGTAVTAIRPSAASHAPGPQGRRLMS
ncbi:MAG: universal stress protein [Variovorax sp.]|nr:MAG: universal stress protein [Variovorax sp.]